ncbi:MAG: bile acid:sodium symporter family protein [Kangiellaceae bacterium]|nr:bile acid:sodium symporter family protein [Kangiellaceae bacterium]
MQVDVVSTVILPFSLFLIMFGLGLSLSLANFAQVFKAPKAVGIGFIGQMLVLPVVAFIVAKSFQLAPEISVGLMILALAPGGATSNMFTYLYKGDVALSISLTVLVSFITPFTIPIIVALSMDHFMGSDSAFQLPVIKTIIQLLVITVVPVTTGMFVLSRWPKLAGNVETFIKYFSILFLFFIIIYLVYRDSDNMLGYFAQAGAASLVLNLVVLFAGYFMAKMAKLSAPQSITIGFEVGIQNGTLALVIAGSLIGNEAMMIPGVVYGLLMFATGTGFGWWVKK